MAQGLSAEAPLTRLGRYHVLHRVGMGGMGLVYAVWDPVLERTVALKSLREDARDTDAFKREFRAIADVAHPNFVRLYDLVSEGGQWFFTMELVRGVDFHSYTSGTPDSGFAQLRTGLAQLADGLSALHDAGLVHGDVKSANVLVTTSGRVVLLDFGLTRRHGEELTDPSLIQGTIPYMAPETAIEISPSQASDWYSVGVMLYRALTGAYPFTGRPLEVLHAKQDRDPVPARQLVPAAPADLLDACDALLDRDPGRRPGGPELLARLGQRAATRARARVRVSDVPPPFIGRPHELAALDDARGACARGATVALFLRGPSGVGKSALLASFASRALAAGALVLQGKCYERESIPYKGLDAAMGTFSRYLRGPGAGIVAGIDPTDIRHLTRLFPVFGWIPAPAQARARAPVVTDPAEQRRRAVGALRGLLASVGGQRPVVIAIDDLHWGDQDGARLLLEILAPPAPAGVLLVLAFRGDETDRSEALRILNAARAVPVTDGGWDVETRDLELESLPHADAVALAHQLLGSDGDAVRRQAETIARESGGNPHFVGELARVIDQRRRSTGEARDPMTALPTLREAIGERIAALPADAQRLLCVVSVAGEPFEPALAIKAANLGPDECDSIDLLLTSKLLRMRQLRERTTIEPYHDRIREVAGQVGDDEACRIHLALARALETQEEPDSERLAGHFLAARADADAARHAAVAADRAAAAFAFDRAASLYAMALQLTSAEVAGRLELEVGYAEALAHAGQAHAAGQAFAVAAERPAGVAELALRLRAADQLLRSGRNAEGMEMYEAALRRLGVPMPGTGVRSVPSILLGRARLRVGGLRPTARLPEQISAADLTRVDALHAASTRLGFVDLYRATQLHNQHVIAALRSGEPYRAARALLNELVGLAGAGSSTERRVGRMLRRLDLLDIPSPVDVPAVYPAVPPSLMRDVARGICAFSLARWKQALPHLRRSIEGFARVHGAAWEMMHQRAYAAWALYFLGELEEYRAQLDAGLNEARDRDDRFGLTMFRLTSGYRFLIDDDPDGGRDEMRHAIDDWDQPGLHYQRLWSGEQLSLICLYQARAAEGWETIERLIQPLSRTLMWGVQLLRVNVRYKRGACAATAAAQSLGREQRAFLDAARRDRDALRRERSPLASAYATSLDAGIAAASHRAGAADLYALAGDAFAEADMAAYAAAARRHALELRGQPTDVEDELLRSRGVVAPARFASALVPVSGSARSQYPARF